MRRKSPTNTRFANTYFIVYSIISFSFKSCKLGIQKYTTRIRVYVIARIKIDINVYQMILKRFGMREMNEFSKTVRVSIDNSISSSGRASVNAAL